MLADRRGAGVETSLPMVEQRGVWQVVLDRWFGRNWEGRDLIQLQRLYEHHRTHGIRCLVERLWPREIRKDSLHFSHWLKDVAPGDSLRRWFEHDTAKWEEFQRRYRVELDEHPDAWAPLVAAARTGDVVFLYSSHDTEHNNAVALRDYVNERLVRR